MKSSKRKIRWIDNKLMANKIMVAKVINVRYAIDSFKPRWHAIAQDADGKIFNIKNSHGVEFFYQKEDAMFAAELAVGMR